MPVAMRCRLGLTLGSLAIGEVLNLTLPCLSVSLIGKVTVKVAPAPGSDATEIVPS